jgi:hypothetical protein
MGIVLSATSSSIKLVVDSIMEVVTDEKAAIADLNDLIQGLIPPNLEPPLIYTNLLAACEAALDAAIFQAKYSFNAKYINPAVSLPVDIGAVLNYTAGGDLQPVIDQLRSDLLNWGLPVDGVSTMAALVQAQVDNSIGMPGSTFGQAAVANSDPLCWTACYGIFRTGNNDAGIFQRAVIYGFTAAIAPAPQPWS